jgi:hypothetical protein
MDAGTFVIALLTAAGAAAGTTQGAPGGLPEATAQAARCIAGPDEDGRTGNGIRGSDELDLPERSCGARSDSSSDARSDAEALAERRADADAGRGTSQETSEDTSQNRGQDTGQDTAALAEELALELADVVAGSDDPTAQRLAAALAAAGFEVEPRDQQQTTASRSGDTGQDPPGDDQLQDDELGQDQLGDNQRGNDQLGDDQLGKGQRDRNQSGDNQGSNDQLDQNRDEAGLDCDGGTSEQGSDSDATGGSGSSDLADVLSSGDESSSAPVDSAADRDEPGAQRDGSRAPVERGGTDIASVLERGERAAG